LIELRMVHRMLRRGALAAPALVTALWFVGDARWAVSGAAGLGLTLLNLWVAGRIIGGIAENAPHLLVAAAMGALVFGLVTLMVALTLLQRTAAVDLPVAGITLAVSHMVLVAWEAASSLLKIPSDGNKELVHGA